MVEVALIRSIHGHVALLPETCIYIIRYTDSYLNIQYIEFYIILPPLNRVILFNRYTICLHFGVSRVMKTRSGSLPSDLAKCMLLG
jgi:hypothetical protein